MFPIQRFFLNAARVTDVSVDNSIVTKAFSQTQRIRIFVTYFLNPRHLVFPEKHLEH